MVLTLEKCHMNLGWWPYSLVGGGGGGGGRGTPDFK